MYLYKVRESGKNFNLVLVFFPLFQDERLFQILICLIGAEFSRF